MLRYGIISEIKNGRARVYFDEIDITSGWLTLPNSMSEIKDYPINCQVAVEMHPNGEDGEILHRTITDDENIPDWATVKVEGYKFSDGTSIYYDPSTKILNVNASLNEIIFDCAKLTVKGTIEATGDVKAGLVSLQEHIHAATPELVAGDITVTGTITIEKP